MKKVQLAVISKPTGDALILAFLIARTQLWLEVYVVVKDEEELGAARWRSFHSDSVDIVKVMHPSNNVNKCNAAVA